MMNNCIPIAFCMVEWMKGCEHMKWLVVIIILVISYFLSCYLDLQNKEHSFHFENLNLIKYVAALFIVILHLRPFIGYSPTLDWVFNNYITRCCVPIFFIITGFFVARKDDRYIYTFIKKTTKLYLVWSILYIPTIIGQMILYLPKIQEYLLKYNLSMGMYIIGAIIIFPIGLGIALIYSGVYYHLWYFPAVISSLLILKWWKKRWNIHVLLGVSLFLLLFGATETYFGVLPLTLQSMLSYYYKIFFTTRNALFFGLFYVVLGYVMGKKENLYIKHSFFYFVLSLVILWFETDYLFYTERLDSNILLSCVPLCYFMFVSAIYFPYVCKYKGYANLSKYYYLVHPMIVFGLYFIDMTYFSNPFNRVIFVLLLTHLMSLAIISMKRRFPSLPI